MDSRQRNLERLAANGDTDAALRLRIKNKEFAVGDRVIIAHYGWDKSGPQVGCEGIVFKINNFIHIEIISDICSNIHYWPCRPHELIHKDENVAS